MAKATSAKDAARAGSRNAAAKGKAGSAKRGIAALELASGAAKAAGALGGKTGTIDRADRIAAGRALREGVPRSANADWEPAADRPDPADVNAQPTDTFRSYAELCGATLARAHPRSGDASAISGYLGKGKCLRQGTGPLRHFVCRSERTRPRGARPGDQRRPGAGRARPMRTHIQGTGHVGHH